MATKTTKKEELKDENMKEDLKDNQAQTPENEPDEPDNSNDGKDEPEKESLGTKAKGFGKKIISGVKKALPYVGAFAAGAGAAVGTLIVLTKPDGTEVDLLPKDDSLVPADEYIEGDATVIDDVGSEE